MKRRAFIQYSGLVPAVAVIATQAGSVSAAATAAPNPDTGKIIVTGKTSTTVFSAAADGVTNDRSIINGALDKALEDLPARVKFGPGVYAIQGSGITKYPPPGAGNLTIEGSGQAVTRLSLTGPSPIPGNFHIIKIKPARIPTVDSEYLHDIVIRDIAFHDSNPAIHANGNEETHGVNIQYCINAQVLNCTVDSLGDEGIELDYVRGGLIMANYLINTPNQEQSGGSAISIKNGCENIIVSNNIIDDDGNSASNLTRGIGIKVIHPVAVRNIQIANNTIRNMKSAGIDLAVIGADADNIIIESNIIENCPIGISRSGLKIQSNSIVTGNIISGGHTGINFNMPADRTIDCSIAFNVINNMASDGIRCSGTRLNLSDNNIRNCRRAIYIYSAQDILIQGGMIDSCGGIGRPNIQAKDTGFNVSVIGVRIISAKSNVYVIRKIEYVRDCIIDQANAGFREQIGSAKEVTGNHINGGIHITGDQCLIANNVLKTLGGGGGNWIRLKNSNAECTVANNIIDASSSSRLCIKAESGSANSLIHGNVCKNGSGLPTIVDVGINNMLASNQDLK